MEYLSQPKHAWINSKDESILNRTLGQILGEEFMMSELRKTFLESEFKHMTKRFDPNYVEKLKKRTLGAYSNTLRELSNQLATNLFKVEHNAFVVGLLKDFGLVDPIAFAGMFGDFNQKIAACASASFRGEDLGYGSKFYVICYKGEAEIVKKEVVNTPEFKARIPKKIGHWSEGKRSDTVKEKKIKRDWFTKCVCNRVARSGSDQCRIVMMEKNGHDGCTIFPSKNFNHQLFTEMHRGVQYAELKLLVEDKYHREKDVEWFKQFETEVK